MQKFSSQVKTFEQIYFSKESFVIFHVFTPYNQDVGKWLKDQLGKTWVRKPKCYRQEKEIEDTAFKDEDPQL